MSSRYHFPVTLGIIVKNESQIIQRCLDRVKGHITGYVVIDTGSMDNTKELVAESLDGVPGVILDREWVDFGYNRSELVVECQRFIAQTAEKSVEEYRPGGMGKPITYPSLMSKNTGYLLLLDADHVFHGDLSGISDDSGYLVELTGDEVGYSMPYIVAADLPWRYIGRTHEYITADNVPFTFEKIESCTIEHRHDGGTRHEKFDRDLKYLEEDYESDPNNERTVYYLAQTYEGMGQTEKAIAMFRHRVQLGGFDQEKFWALFKIAELTGDIGDYMKAWLDRPSRWEPLQRAMHILNEQRRYDSVLTLARVASREASEDHLFVERWVEEWGLSFEVCLALWWTGEVAGAKEGWEAILESPTLTESYRELCLANLQHC